MSNIDNVIPIAGRDRTNAERQRRYRERRRNGVAGRRNGKARAARNGVTASATRNGVTETLKNQSVVAAARAAAEALERLAAVTRDIAEGVTAEPPQAIAQPVTEPKTEAGMAEVIELSARRQVDPPTSPGPTSPAQPIMAAPAPVTRRPGRLGDLLAYAAAVGLAGIAAWFSLKGLAVLFPGSPVAILVMGATMEGSKIIAAGWLAGAWRDVPWVFRGVLMLLIAGLAVINAAGTFSQLTAAHVGNAALNAGAHNMQAVDVDSRLEIALGKLSDLDKQIGGIDAIVAGAAAKGRAVTAQAALADQHKARAALMQQREQAAAAVAMLKTERASVKARAAVAESEAAPIMYAAEVLGIGSDPERAIRFLIVLMVLCCDPLAIVLTAGVSARRKA